MNTKYNVGDIITSKFENCHHLIEDMGTATIGNITFKYYYTMFLLTGEKAVLGAEFVDKDYELVA